MASKLVQFARVLKLAAISIIALVGLAACNDDSKITDSFLSSTEIEGTYIGIVTITESSVWLQENSIPIIIKLKDGKYTCIGVPHNQANISGTYSINDDKIKFEVDVWKTDYIDSEGNIICVDFDTFVIPLGEYNFTFDENEL